MPSADVTHNAVSTVRITASTHASLRELARETGLTMQEIVAEAIEQYRRQRIMDLTNEAYDRLRSDPDAWAELLDERRIWDATLADGIEDK